MEEKGAYDALMQAIEAPPRWGRDHGRPDGRSMTTDQIITIPEKKNIVLDMDCHSITVASNFTGRPIVNKGTLTVTGDGVIDSSASETEWRRNQPKYTMIEMEPIAERPCRRRGNPEHRGVRGTDH